MNIISNNTTNTTNIGELIDGIFINEESDKNNDIIDSVIDTTKLKDINIDKDLDLDDNNDKDLDLDDTESIIDTNWINEYDRLQSIDSNPVREHMNSIGAYFIYINPNDYIENILFEKIVLEFDSEKKSSIIRKETVLKIIQSKKNVVDSKYKLIDILSFVIDIEPENIQSFLKNDLEKMEFNNCFDSKTFMKIIPIFNDIHICKSIFIFHNINSLFFFFKESENNTRRFTLKSILKNYSSDNVKKNTKKVRIVENIRERLQQYKKNKTRKIRNV
jgi:hypothetical protein